MNRPSHSEACDDLVQRLGRTLELARECRYAELFEESARLERICAEIAEAAEANRAGLAPGLEQARRRLHLLSEVLGHTAQVQGCLLEIGHGGALPYAPDGRRAPGKSSAGGGRVREEA